MRGKTLLIVRRLHLYLSVFFAPLLLMFVVSGWAQTMDFGRSSTMMRGLEQVHMHQYYSTGPQADRARGGGGRPDGEAGRFAGRGGGERLDGRGERGRTRTSTMPMKWLVAVMSVSLIISLLLGLVLAFTVVPSRIPVWLALDLGVAVPAGLLVWAHTH